MYIYIFNYSHLRWKVGNPCNLLKRLVGATGFEPATPCAQDRYIAFSCDFLHFPIWP
jgi:hypothetical protein